MLYGKTLAMGICLNQKYITSETLPLILFGIINANLEIPKEFKLGQNYPNPFNPTTKIMFEIPLSKGGILGVVSLKIYDITGREIQTLVNEKLNPGTYEVTFDGSNFASRSLFLSDQDR